MRPLARLEPRGRRGPHSLGFAARPLIIAGILACHFSTSATAADTQIALGPTDLDQMSIEDLANVEVSSVSKSAERLSDAPAAIYVISHDDVIRSGATSIPEMLRLAPNLQVAQIDANRYAITARGFNETLSNQPNKLLILIDGRSVYSPLYAGIYWDTQRIPPEDIERIEVISGPAGTLWGANAMNGVINIITRKSSDTQGGLVDIGGGNLRSGGTVQYGGKAGTETTYRIYGDTLYGADDKLDTGAQQRTAIHNYQSGFRFDWTPQRDVVTVQGDKYVAFEEQGTGNQFLSGQNLIGRWNHQLEGGSALQVQAYYDGVRRFGEGGGGGFGVDTYDLDIQHSFALGTWNKVVWGGGERVTQFNIVGIPGSIEFIPANRTLSLTNVFVEDTISLTDSLKFILGTKLEDDPYVGLAPLPSARLSWKVTETDLLWSAVSRAIRAPTPFDRDLNLGGGFLVGGPNFQSEKLTAYEIGYRSQITPDASVSVSTYYNQYDDLRSYEVNPAGGFFPIQFGNTMEGNTYGVEVWGDYKVNAWWRLSAGMNIQHENFFINGPSANAVALAFHTASIQQTGNDPAHQASLRSSINITPAITFDADLREVAELPNPRVSEYVELGMRLGWNVTDSLLASISGFNLLHDHHVEFGTSPGATEVGRSFYANLQWRF